MSKVNPLDLAMVAPAPPGSIERVLEKSSQ